MKRQLLIVSVLTGLAQLAAFFKLWFTAHIFGVSSELDGYNLALVTPTLISGLLSGLLQVGLFPVRSKIGTTGPAAETAAFDRTVWWGYAALGALLVGILFLLSGWLGTVIVPVNQTATLTAFLSVMPLAAFLVAIGMMTDCSGYILAMRGSFLTAASAPVANGLLGGIMLAVWPQGGLDCLIWGTVCGAALQLAICIYRFQRISFHLLGPLAIRDRRPFKEISRLGAWALPGVAFSNIAVSLPSIWAASFGEGAVSAFGYAYRLHLSAVQLLVMASSTMILARFSELVAAGDTQSVRRLLKKAALLSLGLGICAIVGVASLGEYILTLLFSGKFDGDAAEKVTQLWVWLSVGLGFNLLGNVFAKLWQAQARPILLSLMGGAGLMMLCLSYFILRGFVGEKTIAIAITCSSISGVLLGIRFLNPPKRKL